MARAKRRTRTSGETTAQAIEQIAVDLFFKKSFQATSLRELATDVGIQVGSLYNHIPSKRELLFRIMKRVMLDLIEQQRAVAQREGVVERMRALIYNHVYFHGQRAKEVFIGNSELRSLDRGQRARIVALRDEYERLFQDALRDGIKQGRFLPVNVKVVSYGLIAMTTWVSSWYSPRGALSLEEIAHIYADLALRSLWNPAAGAIDQHLERVSAVASRSSG